CDRTLRVSIDDRRVASIKMPMNRKAACERAFAAAALHRCHRDDRAHLSSVSRPPTQRIIRINVIVFFENCLPVGDTWPRKNKLPAAIVATQHGNAAPPIEGFGATTGRGKLGRSSHRLRTPAALSLAHRLPASLPQVASPERTRSQLDSLGIPNRSHVGCSWKARTIIPAVPRCRNISCARCVLTKPNQALPPLTPHP